MSEPSPTGTTWSSASTSSVLWFRRAELGWWTMLLLGYGGLDLVGNGLGYLRLLPMCFMLLLARAVERAIADARTVVDAQGIRQYRLFQWRDVRWNDVTAYECSLGFRFRVRGKHASVSWEGGAFQDWMSVMKFIDEHVPASAPLVRWTFYGRLRSFLGRS